MFGCWNHEFYRVLKGDLQDESDLNRLDEDTTNKIFPRKLTKGSPENQWVGSDVFPIEIVSF